MLGRFAKLYRDVVVKPARRDYDRLASEASEGRPWPYQQFQVPFEGFHDGILLVDWASKDWFKLKVWSIARSCGRLPLAAFGNLGLLWVLETCPLCLDSHADLQHCLGVCPVLEFDRQQLGYRCNLARACAKTSRPDCDTRPLPILHVQMFCSQPAWQKTYTLRVQSIQRLPCNL